MAVDLCADDAADAVIVAAAEVDGPETRAYSDDASDTIELGAALLLERGGTGAALLAADTGFADPAGANVAAQLRRLGDRLLAGIGAAAVRGPRGGAGGPGRGDRLRDGAPALDSRPRGGRRRPGGGAARRSRHGRDGGLGVALASDRNGWIGAAVVAGRVPSWIAGPARTGRGRPYMPR